MHPDIPPYIYIIFTAATAIGVLMQACILLGMALGLRELQKKIEAILNNVTVHALPMIAASRVTLEDIGPKLKIISANLVEISETLKSESHNIKGSVDDVLERTRAQTARVDDMVSGTLDGITHASASIQRGIAIPIRQFSGLINGLKAGFSVLREKSASSVPDREAAAYRGTASGSATTPAEVLVIVQEAEVGRGWLIEAPEVPAIRSSKRRGSQAIQPPPTTSSLS